MRSLFKKSETYLFLVIISISVLIALINHRFLSLQNLFNLLKTYSFLGILASGVLVVIISGGIDISFAAVATVAEYLMATVVIHWGGNILTAFLIASLIGMFLGLANALLIYHFKIPTVIATIATMNVFYGILIMATGGKWIYTLPGWFSSFEEIRLFTFVNASGGKYGLSMVIVIWFAVLIITSFILRHTVTGRGIYAMGSCGSDHGPVERAGYNVFKIHIFIYTYMGLLAGIAGVVQALLVQTVAPNSIVGTELSVIAPVILGGASIAGGTGSVTGTVLGVALLAIIGNGLTLMRIPSYWYDVLTGGVIILSVTLNAMRTRKKQTRVIEVEELVL
jgi:simple sugar transport system permease protein